MPCIVIPAKAGIHVWFFKEEQREREETESSSENTAHTPRKHPVTLIQMVGLDRIELSTSRLSGVRSNHLSYRPIPLTPALSHWERGRDA